MLLIVLGILIALRSNQRIEIAVDQAPSFLTNFMARHFPKLNAVKLFLQNGRYYVFGSLYEQKIELELRPSGNQPEKIAKAELHFEMEKINRNIRDKRPIELQSIPDGIREKCIESLIKHVGPIDYFDRCRIGITNQGRAYDLKGRSGNQRFEIEMLESGRLLEIEIKYKSNIPDQFQS